MRWSATRLPSPTLLLPLRHGPFRFLFAGQVVSNLGDWLDSLAVLALVVYDWQQGPVGLAALTLAWMVPGVVVGPLAGVLADRWPKRRTMIACDLIRAVIVLGLIWAPNLSVLIALQFAKAVFSSLFSPARQAAIRLTLPEDDLLAANALSRMVMHATKVFGPVLGGLLVVAIGARPVFALDALSFAISAACLSRLPTLDAAADTEPKTRQHFFRELAEGVTFVFGSTLLRVAVLAIMAEMVIVEINDTLTVLAFKGLGMNQAMVGLALGGSGLGNVLASVGLAQWGQRIRPLVLIGAGMVWIGVLEAAIGVALVVGLTGNGAPWLPVLVACGAGFACVWVPYACILQRATPPALMARVSASADGLANVCGLIGPPLGALLASNVGVGPVFGGTGAALVVLGGVVALTQVREITVSGSTTDAVR